MERRNDQNAAGLLPLMLAAALAGSFIRPFGQTIRQPAAQGYLLAGLAAAPVLFFLLSLYGGSAAKRRRPVWAGVLLAGVLALSSGMELIQCQRFYNYVLADQLPVFWFLVLALSVAGCAAAYSKQALNRVSLLVLVLLAGSLVLLVVSVAPQMRAENLQYAQNLPDQIGLGLPMRLALLPEYLLFPLLSGQKPPAARRGYAWLLGLGFGLESLLAVLSESVLGAAGLEQTQPIYTIARLGGISVFRRLDAVHVGVWLLLFFIKLGLYLWACIWLMQGALPSLRRAGGCFAGLFLILCAFGFLWVSPYAQYAYPVQQGLLWLVLVSSFVWRKCR